MKHHFEVYPITLWSMTKDRKIVWDETKKLWVLYTSSRRVDAARDIYILCRAIHRYGDYMIIPPGTPHVVFPKETDISDVFEHMFLRKTLALMGSTQLPYSEEIGERLQNIIIKQYSLETLTRLGIHTSCTVQTAVTTYGPRYLYSHPLFSYGTTDYPDQFS